MASALRTNTTNGSITCNGIYSHKRRHICGFCAIAARNYTTFCCAANCLSDPRQFYYSSAFASRAVYSVERVVRRNPFPRLLYPRNLRRSSLHNSFGPSRKNSFSKSFQLCQTRESEFKAVFVLHIHGPRVFAANCVVIGRI